MLLICFDIEFYLRFRQSSRPYARTQYRIPRVQSAGFVGYSDNFRITFSRPGQAEVGICPLFGKLGYDLVDILFARIVTDDDIPDTVDFVSVLRGRRVLEPFLQVVQGLRRGGIGMDNGVVCIDSVPAFLRGS